MVDQSTLDILLKMLTIQHEENNRLRAVINNIPSSIYWKDKDGRYMGYNNAGERHAESQGLPHKAFQILGKTDYDIFPKKTAKQYRNNDLDVMNSGKEIHKEETLILSDGKKRTQISTKSPLKDYDGNIIGIVGNTVDVTYLKTIEQELRLATGKAERALLSKNQFLKNIQHDIRTPFAGIIGLTELLIRHESDPIKRVDLNDILNCSKELLSYCNKILEFCEIENKTVPSITKHFCLTNLTARIIRIETPAAKHKNLDFCVNIDPDVPKIVLGDEYRLYTILLNLVSNAIKFTKTGHITLSIHNLHQKDNECLLQFKVIDTGIGIEKDNHDVIFEKFSRLIPSYKGTYRGIGLGLKIVNELIQELKGTISLNSEPNKGSTFTCDIPFRIHE